MSTLSTIQRKYVIHDYLNVNISGGDDRILNPVNDKFLERVTQIIFQHLTENEFSIEEFSREVGISRAHLHRKLKALTGKSASRYIMAYRLSLAREMIRNHAGNISEIAYSVGFSSPIYFSRCFKEVYGYPPSKLLIN